MPKPILTDPAVLQALRDQFSGWHAKNATEDLLAPDNEVFDIDCLALLRRFPDESVDMLFTDEPYGITSSVISFIQRKAMVTEFDFDGDLPAHLTIPWVYEAERVLKPGGALVNCGIAGWSSTYEDVIADAGLDFRANIVWLKTNPPTRVRHGGWRSGHEMIWVASKGSLNKRMKKVYQQELLNWHIETRCPNCNLHFPATYSKQYGISNEDWIAHLAPYKSHHRRVGHPTEKPDWIATKYIDLLTQEGDLVVDPFMGSGWSVVNAAKMKRRYVGTDIGCNNAGIPWSAIVKNRLGNIQFDFI